MNYKNKENDSKKIMIFGITDTTINFTTYGALLVTKMNDYAKKKSINVVVDMNSISKIDDIGKEVDIIMLTPELYNMENDIKEKFSDKIVRLIEKKDYASLDAENIFNSIL